MKHNEQERDRAAAAGISLEPRWRALMPILIVAIENGTEIGRANARRSLLELAEKLDRVNPVYLRAIPALRELMKVWPKAEGLTSREETALLEAADVLTLSATGSGQPAPGHDGSRLSEGLDERTRDSVEEVLGNDESSHDDDLIKFFIEEFCLPEQKARALVANRTMFLNFLPSAKQPRPDW